MKTLGLAVCGLFLTVGAAWVVAQETSPAAVENSTAKASLEQQYSYAIGLDMGTQFRKRDTPLNIEQVIAGLQDGLGGGKPKFDQQTCGTALQQLAQLMSMKAASAQTAFLAENKTKEGVQVTNTGLQYKVLKAGTGKTPGPTDTVKCNYSGSLIDGTVFDASARHGGPAEFPVNGVIPGWTEALQMMKVGAKWQLFIPAQLAYGNSPPPGTPIEPGSTLVFDIELLDIK